MSMKTKDEVKKSRSRESNESKVNRQPGARLLTPRLATFGSQEWKEQTGNVYENKGLRQQGREVKESRNRGAQSRGVKKSRFDNYRRLRLVARTGCQLLDSSIRLLDSSIRLLDSLTSRLSEAGVNMFPVSTFQFPVSDFQFLLLPAYLVPIEAS